MSKPTIVYTIECLPEDTDIRGNFVVSGDADEDRRIEDAVIRDLNSGNPWAWCCVKVTARIDGLDLEGTDYLGGCNYRSEEDFKQDAYFADMKLMARNDLIKQMRELKRHLIQIEVDALNEAVANE